MINITLPSVVNIRDFGGTVNKEGRTIRRNCMIRSGFLINASEEDISYLQREHNLKKVIDLRTFSEIEEAPDQTGTLEYIHVPIIRDFRDGITHENRESRKFPDLADTYRDMVCKEEYVEGLRNVLNEILDHDYDSGAVLWHCSEGKDRCGLISALVMMILDVDEKTIREDYLETNKTSIPKAETIYKRIAESGDEEIAKSVYKALIADERYLNTALNSMTDNYLEDVLKLDKNKIEKFRNRILI
ncbi:MAG: tyrosine-protein phosphatase [Erysipelotrichaceae bacterium]|jgi:protein-tyrosine phosphatase|nr:tyrosine-protein phosphatase [Erysipelotrichaceae bacterium]